MKKAVIFVFLAMVVIGSCAAQSATADQRIVGTWIREDGSITFVFNANGTGTGNGENFIYGISSGGFVYITYPGNSSWSPTGSNIIYFSPDGRRMIIGSYRFQKK